MSDNRCDTCDALLSKCAIEHGWASCGSCRDAETLANLDAENKRLREALEYIHAMRQEPNDPVGRIARKALAKARGER